MDHVSGSNFLFVW